MDDFLLKFIRIFHFFFIPKDAQGYETDYVLQEFFFVAIFSFWDMFDFVLNIRSEPDLETLTRDTR